MTNNIAPVSYILTCPPGTYLPEMRVMDLLDNIGNNHLTVAVAGISARTASMLKNLASKTNRLELFISEGQQDYTTVLEQALQEEITRNPLGLTVLIHGRIELSKQKISVAITDFTNCQECGFAVASHAHEESISSCSFVLDMLQNPFYPLFIILKNELFKQHTTILRDGLFFFALPELLLRLSLQTKFKILPPLYLQNGSVRSPKNKNENEQRIMDEENSVLEEYQKYFFEHQFKLLPTKEFTSLYQYHTKQVVELLKNIQNEIPVSVEEYDNHIFRYCLLALFSGEVENACQIMETSFSFMSERPALMRLYKLIALYFPVKEHPVSGPEKISVVIPMYNQGHYLEETVMSVIRQTWTNWEMIIINDGSTDSSYEIAKELVGRLNDSRIKLITQENSGKGGARNRGIRESDGEFVITLDSDDMVTPEYFSESLKLMKKHSRAAWITPKTLVFGKDNHVAWSEDYNFIRAIAICPSPSSSLIRRCALEEVGLYREDLTDREDAEIWIRLLENGWISVTTEKPLFLYRHACRRFGLKIQPNVSSKEEITSLHPWWFRLDLSVELRKKAFTASPIYLFPDWFLNWQNINKIIPLFNDRKAFSAAMKELKNSYPAITKPKRWDFNNHDFDN